MNKKRWTALGVAVAIMVFSFITQMTTWISSASVSNLEEDIFTIMFETDSGLSETTIEEGSSFERIVVLPVNGAIIDSGVSSFLDTTSYNHQEFLESLKLIQEDSTIAGVILAVNSPGGGVFESAQIKSQLDALQRDFNLPIYVSFGSIAASGGYYISAGADKIFASKESLTGSIGVIMQTYNVSGLMDSLGISDETIKSGEYKDIGSSMREMTEGEREILQDMINNSYEDFVSIIVHGRNMPEEEVRKVADGRIYDGRQAKEVGLVDDFGYLDDVIQAMRDDFDLADATVFSYSTGTGFGSLFFNRVQDLLKSNSLTTAELEKFLGRDASSRLMYLYGE